MMSALMSLAALAAEPEKTGFVPPNRVKGAQPAQTGDGSAPKETHMETKVRLAPKPPLGWNSYDRFGTSVTEAEVRAQAEAMAKLLLPYGWNYLVIDGGWYNPPRTKDKSANQQTYAHVDPYGRLLPDETRFPSAAGGAGFKPLADFVHKQGLKFGLHIMRGIPRVAARDRLPILNTQRTADELADRDAVCPWSQGMWGLDWSRPEAQAYYDSIFRLYAEWQVDFVKMDDLIGYPKGGEAAPYHKHDVAAARAAADATGREMVLSLSPGNFAFADLAPHMKRYVQMARISGDFWDRWGSLKHMFDLCPPWVPYVGDGFWMDCDMLPMGMIGMRKDGTRAPDRASRFTHGEQRLMMTFWAICRSPLFFGGDLTLLDEATLALLQNREVLAVNQDSGDTRPLFRRGEQLAWVVSLPDGQGRYVALFNLADNDPAEMTVSADDLGLQGRMQLRNLWTGRDLGSADALRLTVAPHEAELIQVLSANVIGEERK
jgi:hypothetical protein